MGGFTLSSTRDVKAMAPVKLWVLIALVPLLMSFSGCVVMPPHRHVRRVVIRPAPIVIIHPREERFLIR